VLLSASPSNGFDTHVDSAAEAMRQHEGKGINASWLETGRASSALVDVGQV
jgi:hypothetical protein